MPSTKTRVNLTVPKTIERELLRISRRDDRSVSTVALALIQQALEIEEDGELLKIALERDTKNAKFVSHEQAWK